MNRRTLAVALAGGLTLSTLAACSTTFDPTLSTSAETTVATSTTLPSGTVAELLPLMLAEVKALGERVAAGDDAGAAADRIEQYWNAMRDEITADNPDMVEDFEFIVRRTRAAADRKRPADADRAYRNLQTLADSLLD